LRYELFRHHRHVAVELRPSTAVSRGELAALFTAAYEGYFISFSVDEATLGYMVDVFDLDLGQSFVADDEGVLVGLANLGRRGARTWLGGVGVVPSRRGEGIGELLTRSLLERTGALGAREMVLEVIVENLPAISLYDKLGFVRTRELEVLSLAAEANGGAAEVAPLEVVRRLVWAQRDGEEPWQRDDDTVDRLLRRDPAPGGIVAGDAGAIFRTSGDTVSLVQAAGDERGLAEILASLRARVTVSAVNYPAGGAVARALRAAGAEVRLRQYEMVKPL
jgi:ribosomal protein S18 acetylase RimI-like enzyme